MIDCFINFESNDQTTLVRTSIADNEIIGKWIANKLNQSNSLVQFFIPLKGFSALDKVFKLVNC
jgi:uncharacterized protein (UPF0261 family)